jgi:hypothetical protein
LGYEPGSGRQLERTAGGLRPHSLKDSPTGDRRCQLPFTTDCQPFVSRPGENCGLVRGALLPSRAGSGVRNQTATTSSNSESSAKSAGLRVNSGRSPATAVAAIKRSMARHRRGPRSHPPGALRTLPRHAEDDPDGARAPPGPWWRAVQQRVQPSSWPKSRVRAATALDRSAPDRSRRRYR